jgi:hypothetical protein
LTPRPALTRALILLAVGAGLAAGCLAGGAEASSRAAGDAELIRLLRGMAVLKALFATGILGGVLWRLGGAASWAWLLAYGAASAVTAAGLAMIWNLSHLVAGALLLHGGLLASIVLLWRDPVVGARLGALVALRRAAIARRQ